MSYTVKEVAKVAGVSIRALHHYDEIGLLKPASVSPVGYRLYSDADLERLQQVLFFRELDFSLQDIKRMLDNPTFDRRQALMMHRELLQLKRERLQRLIQSVDETIESLEGRTAMSSRGMFDGFDESKLREYREEARQRWGHTEAWAESERRTSQYSEQDWAAIRAESGEIYQGLAERMGQDPGSPEVQELVGRWHRLISDRFYECPPEMVRGLGNMYVEDSRFTAFYDRIKPGLAEFLRQGMHIYADRLEAQR